MSIALALLSLVLAYFSPGELFPTLAPYHIQMAILVPALVISAGALAMRQTGLPSPQYVLMFGLWFAVVASLLSKFWLRSSFNAFIDFGIIVVIFFLILMNGSSHARLRLIGITFVACGLVMAVQGMISYYTGWNGDKLLDVYIGQGLVTIKRIRAYGFLGDANDFAQFLLVALAMLGLFWRKRNLAANLLVLGPPALVIVYGIYLTGSRGAIIGLVVVFFSTISGRLGMFKSMLLAGLLFVLMVVGRFGGGREISLNESSAAGRVILWGEGIAELKHSPIFGVGFEQFGERNSMTAHNSFVLCFAELGIFGYFFWLALVVTTLIGLHRLARAPVKSEADEDARRYAVTLRSALYCFLATSWFLSRTYNITLYVLVAMGAALVYQRRETLAEDFLVARRWIPLTLAYQAASVVLVYVTIRVRNL
jgi:putative inorganic carbon (hco3(-)) transporter